MAFTRTPDYDYLLDLGQGFGDRPGKLREHIHEHLVYGSLVVFTPGFGFPFHGLGLCNPPGLQDINLGAAFQFAGNCLSFGFHLVPVTLGLGRLSHRGVKLLLLALDFCFFDLNRFLLRNQDCLGLFFLKLLVHPQALKLVGEVGFGTFLVDRCLELGTFGLVVSCGLCNLSLGLELGNVTLFPGYGSLYGGILGRVGLGYLGIMLRPGNLRPAKCFKITLSIGYVGE